MKLYLKYSFENFIARKSNFIYILVVAAAFFAFIMIILETSLGVIENDSIFNLWWIRFERLLEIDISSTSNKERLINLFYWLFSVAFSGTIIAFLAAKISSFIEDLKKGYSGVIDKNHYVIIGWNPTIFDVFKEIKTANSNQSRPTILCFNTMDNIKMNTLIDLEFPDKKGLRIITRSGSIYSPQDLARTNLQHAKSIIILDDILVPNYNIETTILAAKINVPQNKTPIITQLKKNKNVDLLKEVMEGAVYPVQKDKVISNVTAQCIRNKFISQVVLDFLDYDGDEIYFYPSKELSGKTFKQAMFILSDATLIGIKNSNQNILINPNKDYIIQEDDFLVVIAEDDDDSLNLINVSDTDKLLNKINITNSNPTSKEKLSILILGWSDLGRKIINKTIPFLDDGSIIHFNYIEELVNQPPVDIVKDNIKFTYTISDHDQKTSIKNTLNNNQFDVILILGHDDILPNKVADTNSLIINLFVRSILEKQKKLDLTRIILQLNDGSKKELIKNNEISELIVSDTLSSLMISQLAENPELWFVFEEIFNEQELKISISSILNYQRNVQNKKLSVTDMMLMTLEKNQTFIGFVADNKLSMNPRKNQTIDFKETISLVYIA